MRPHGVQGGIESLHVTDLQDPLTPGCDVDELIGLGDGPRDRLFDEDMDVVAQQLQGHLVVVRGGRGDDRGVNGARRQRAEIGDAGREELAARGIPGGGQGLDDPRQFDVRSQTQQPSVNASQMTGADDGDS